MTKTRALMLALGGLLLFSLEGCTLPYADPGPSIPLYPRAEEVRERTFQQIDSIEWAVRKGDLDEDIADALADNDDLVLELTHYYQDSFTPRRDLTLRESDRLHLLLDDNQTLLDDAIRRRQAWRWFFNRGFSSYPSDPFERRIYGVCLHYQVKVQYYQVQSQERSGRLTPTMAREMRDRITIIRENRLAAVRGGGSLAPDREGAVRLEGMVKDNSHLLKEREKGYQGAWTGDRSGAWKDKSSQGTRKVYREDRWRNDDLRVRKGSKKGWERVEDEDVRAPTPIPAARPTPTPLPDLRETDEERKGTDRKGRHRSQDRSGKEREGRVKEDLGEVPAPPPAVSEDHEEARPKGQRERMDRQDRKGRHRLEERTGKEREGRTKETLDQEPAPPATVSEDHEEARPKAQKEKVDQPDRDPKSLDRGKKGRGEEGAKDREDRGSRGKGKVRAKVTVTPETEDGPGETQEDGSGKKGKGHRGGRER